MRVETKSISSGKFILKYLLSSVEVNTILPLTQIGISVLFEQVYVSVFNSSTFHVLFIYGIISKQLGKMN